MFIPNRSCIIELLCVSDYNNDNYNFYFHPNFHFMMDNNNIIIIITK